MAYKVILRKLALKSLWEAVDWYENQSPGLGSGLQKEFFEHLKKLQDNPHHAAVFHPYRRILLKRFPYKIVYAVDEKRKRVMVAVLWHSKRSPEALKKMLKK